MYTFYIHHMVFLLKKRRLIYGKIINKLIRMNVIYFLCAVCSQLSYCVSNNSLKKLKYKLIAKIILNYSGID